jgi:short-subunit dehydrogenase
MGSHHLACEEKHMVEAVGQQQTVPPSIPLAFVTGASSGIGASFARQLAQRGYNLIVLARRTDRLKALGDELQHTFGIHTEMVVADLATAEGISRAVAVASSNDLDLVVNNAGFGGYSRFVDADPAVLEALVSVHILAPLHITRAALPRMLQRDKGAVINVASILALSGPVPPRPGMPFRSTYSATKAFLLTFTQALAHELQGTGVRVQACLPGLTATEFHLVQGIDVGSTTDRMDPDDVARASLKALETGELVCVPGLEDRSLLVRLEEIQQAVLAGSRNSRLASRYL